MLCCLQPPVTLARTDTFLRSTMFSSEQFLRVEIGKQKEKELKIKRTGVSVGSHQFFIQQSFTLSHCADICIPFFLMHMLFNNQPCLLQCGSRFLLASVYNARADKCTLCL